LIIILTKPWDPPEEKLYPILTDLLEDWQGHYRPDFRGIKVIGYQYSPKSHDIKEFLSGYLVPYLWLDANTDEAKQAIKLNNLEVKDLPAIIFADGTLLKTPAVKDIAAKIGLNQSVKNELYDVVIIGAGPAGLAASVYGSSEGLKTLLIEKKGTRRAGWYQFTHRKLPGFPGGA
jgi:thioredoxin reductase (NADPH)